MFVSAFEHCLGCSMFKNIEIPSPKRNQKLQTGWEGFFPYYAGFPESFARAIIAGARLSPAQLVFDPWNGSGTTTYVASTHAVSSVGFDLNPVMVVVAKARLLPAVEADSLEPLGAEILKSSCYESAIVENDPLTWWFSEDTARVVRQIELSIRRHLVGARTVTPTTVNLNNLSCLAATNYVALFSVCRELCVRFQSSNPTWLRRPREDERQVRAQRSTIERRFATKLREMAAALAKCEPTRPREPIISDIRLADTTLTGPEADSVDLILTSPPYCTRIDYTAATRIELAVLQPLVKQLPEQLGRQMTGSTRVPDHPIEPRDEWGAICTAFLKVLKAHPSKASKGYYYKTHLDYFDKMDRSLAVCAAALRKDAVAVMVVQDSFYKDVHNDLPTIVSEMSRSHGLVQIRRQDFYIRRSMGGINPGARLYQRRPGANEAVLCLQKH